MAKKPLTPAQNEALDHDGDHKAGGAPAGGNHAAKLAAEAEEQSDSGLDGDEGASTLTGGVGGDSLVSQDEPVALDPASGDDVAAEATEESPEVEEAVDELIEPTAAEKTGFPQAQTDATAKAAHDAAVAAQRGPGPATEAHLQAALDHIELRVSELANFIRSEALAQGVSEGSLFGAVGRRLGEVLGLD